MVLFIDACCRENSRTRELAQVLLSRLEGEKEHLRLYEEQLPVLDAAGLEERTAACAAGDFSAPAFRFAKRFAQADTVVIAAPYWDLSFPAVLKRYIESICVTGLTFRYNENGQPEGLCRAKKLYYVTTAGGPVFSDAGGFGYVSAVAEGLFGISETRQFRAENLDIIGNDAEAILAAAKAGILKAEL